MKKLILGTSFIVGLSPLAKANSVDGQFAVLKSEKACDIIVPAGLSKSQVYFSKDCSTAFILPAQKIKAAISQPVYLTGSNDGVCAAYYAREKNLPLLDEKLNAINQRISEASDQKPRNEEEAKNIAFQIKNLKDLAAMYKKDLKEGFSQFDNMAALRVKFAVANDIMESVMAFQTANLTPGVTPGATYPIRIMPAQTGDSTLVVSNPEAELYSGRIVTRVNFPGFRVEPKQNLSDDPNASYVAINGALSGIVDISASAYCTNLKKGNLQKEIIAQSVSLNLYYDVKVQTGVKLYVNATLQTKEFLRQLSNVVLKSKYERRDFTTDLIRGGLQNSIVISMDDKGEATDLESLLLTSESSPVASLVSKVLSKYIDRVEDKLEQLGVFSKGEPQRAKEVSNGTEEQTVGYREVCHRKSGFFGIGASSSCSRQPITILIDRAGFSELAQQQEDNSYITEEVVFESNKTNSILHSSTFVY